MMRDVSIPVVILLAMVCLPDISMAVNDSVELLPDGLRTDAVGTGL